MTEQRLLLQGQVGKSLDVLLYYHCRTAAVMAAGRTQQSLQTVSTLCSYNFECCGTWPWLVQQRAGASQALGAFPFQEHSSSLKLHRPFTLWAVPATCHWLYPPGVHLPHDIGLWCLPLALVLS